MVQLNALIFYFVVYGGLILDTYEGCREADERRQMMLAQILSAEARERRKLK